MSYSMTITELLSSVGLSVGSPLAELVVSDIVLDSRKVTQGSVFCAYLGGQVDGRNYIEQALQTGAVAVFCDPIDFSLPTQLASSPVIMVDDLQAKVGELAAQFYAQPSQAMQIFGITGTNGKTTCCFMLAQALTMLGKKTAMIGTIGTGQIESLKYCEGQATTPDPISVQRLLAEWRDQKFSHVCMEVSSHALDQGRVAGVQFFSTLFTNLSHDHLDYHGDMSAYATVKRSLFTDFHSELVVTNAGDELGASLINVANSDFIASYGDAGDVCLETAELTANGMVLDIVAGDVDFTVNTSLVGKVNIPNILLLITTLLALSIDVEEIQSIVTKLKPAPGRMELYSIAVGPQVVIDFAHTPEALQQALLSIREHCAGELWCVFGCGGDRDRAKREIMGATASQNAERLVVTNDNPRSEKAQSIADDILKGVKGGAYVELDRAAAIRHALENAGVNDWVLIAGKGHENTQQIGDKYLPFSDREQVAQFLGAAA